MILGVTPRIMLDSDIGEIKAEIRDLQPEGILSCNPGTNSLHPTCHIDYSQNVFNDIDITHDFPIVSPELSLRDLSGFQNKAFATMVHGRLRLMTLRHRFDKNSISDGKGRFFIKTIRNGSEIINEKELGLFSRSAELLKRGINSFYVDTDRNISRVVAYYRSVLDGNVPDDRKLKKEYVLGWHFRGVE